MKTLRLLALAALLVAAATVSVALAQEHPTAEHPSAPKQAAAPAHAADGVLAAAAADGRFTKFLAAVKAAGLTDKLQGDGPFTVFAPTDEAFAKLPAGTLDDLMAPAGKARLAGLLANHVIPGKLLAGKMKTMKAANVNGQDLAITVNDGQVTVDGAKVVGKELDAGNGVVHAIDTVLVPSEPVKDPDQAKPKDHPGH